jgi:putative ATP-binding cassette transporter
MNKKPHLPRHITQLLLCYFTQSEQKWQARLLLGTVLALTASLILISAVLTYWYKYFYNALQAYDSQAIFKLLGFFCIIATVHIILAVYQFYLKERLAINWRRWLSEAFIKHWLADKSYYHLQTFDEHTDNPDQRICDDVQLLVYYSLNLFLGLINALGTLLTFSVILWQLSHIFAITIAGKTLHLPGYLVWASLLYAALGTWLTFKIGKPLIHLNFEQQRKEANFRFSAIHTRTHAEHIAMYGGEAHEQKHLNTRLSAVLENYLRIVLREKILLWFTAGYNQISIIVPILLALPNYLMKAFKLGGLMQALSAFGQVQGAFSFFVDAFTTIAEWRAVIRRLMSFIEHMDAMHTTTKQHDHIRYLQHTSSSLKLSTLTLTTPKGQLLLKQCSYCFQHGEHYLIKGPSGTGKTTLFRAMAGLWPFGQGDISLPTHQHIMYLPQQPFMPIGTLAQALRFPYPQQSISDQTLKETLQRCQLTHLIDSLHTHTLLKETLSPGEQQRIAFARILLHCPDWICLDESTSALDQATEQSMYETIQSALPNSSLISISHRHSLDRFHDKQLQLNEGMLA